MVTLAMARERALENARAIAEGRDPRRVLRTDLRRSVRDGHRDPRRELEARRQDRAELARDTVVELSNGEDHGTYDSWDEVALCLAFARLSLDEVEV